MQKYIWSLTFLFLIAIIQTDRIEISHLESRMHCSSLSLFLCEMSQPILIIFYSSMMNDQIHYLSNKISQQLKILEEREPSNNIPLVVVVDCHKYEDICSKNGASDIPLILLIQTNKNILRYEGYANPIGIKSFIFAHDNSQNQHSFNWGFWSTVAAHQQQISYTQTQPSTQPSAVEHSTQTQQKSSTGQSQTYTLEDEDKEKEEDDMITTFVNGVQWMLQSIGLPQVLIDLITLFLTIILYILWILLEIAG